MPQEASKKLDKVEQKSPYKTGLDIVPQQEDHKFEVERRLNNQRGMKGHLL